MTIKDPNQIRQAIADFDLFLSGKRAPALIGHSLATVVRLDIPQIAGIIVNWAARNREQHLLDALMGARNKVFDIFFYRVVKFEGIYSFFPAFEAALVTTCPVNEQAHLDALFRQFKWEDIRPIGTLRDHQRFVIEKRPDIKVQTEQFNENIYKNATFSVLSADKKYDFNDEQTSQNIAAYQDKVKGIFNDFLDLVQDKQQKKEILLANESDKYNDYKKKESFKIEIYLTQLLDLAIALFNDDFIYQSVQLFGVIRELRSEYKLKLEDVKKFQEKGELFNTQKIDDYANSRAGLLLMKQILSLFTYWQPRRLLDQLQVEDNRRIRRLLLKVMECYGKEIYGLLVAELQSRAHTLPWYYTRNVSYLLGRITCNDESLKKQAVDLLCDFWQPGIQRQLVHQIITTLGNIGTDLACSRLIERMKLIEPQIDKDRGAADIYQKIIGALVSIESDRALEVALDGSLKNELLGQFTDKFPKIHLTERTVQMIAGKVRKEISRLKFSFSLLGDKETALELLRSIGHMGTETVQALCRDIIKSMPRKHALTIEAERFLQNAVPLPLYAKDHTLQKMAMVKNHTEMICYIQELTASGRMVIRTMDGINCDIEFDRGEAVRASVPSYYLDRENGFYWAFLLDARDIDSVFFQSLPQQGQPDITRPTEALICEGLIQRGQMLQVTNNYLSPDSRFRQKAVSQYLTAFSNTSDPEKYKLVWDALTQNVDIPTLQQTTMLSKNELFKILFFFLKQNMIEVDGDEQQKIGIDIEDGIAMLDMNLKRIEKRPVMFNYYKTSAEVCADLMRTIEDDLIRFAFGVLRNYFLEYFQFRKVFASTNIEICQQLLEWVVAYAQQPGDEARQSLLDYISFTFKIEDASLQPAPAPPPDESETTVLEKLENIDLANDPLDLMSGDSEGFDDSMFDDMLGSLDSVLGSGMGFEGEEGEAAPNPSLTEAEESMIRDLFDNIALAYVKPLKDFIRELYRNWENQRPTSFEWLEIIEPIFTLISGSSAKMGYQSIADVVNNLHQVVLNDKTNGEQEGRESFCQDAAQEIIVAYQKLCELQPKTFALAVSEEDLNDKKEVLVVKFILKQVPEVTDKILNKILFAGLNSFDKFMQSKPDEIAALTGMAKALSEEIYMKFYQYRNIYYQHGDADYHQKFLAMFELNLRLLKEMHTDVEILAIEEQMGKEDAKQRKEVLMMERQRMLWSLFIMLCIKQEYDLVETVQQSVFDVRIQLLEEYLVKLAAMPQGAYAES